MHEIPSDVTFIDCRVMHFNFLSFVSFYPAYTPVVWLRRSLLQNTVTGQSLPTTSDDPVLSSFVLRCKPQYFACSRPSVFALVKPLPRLLAATPGVSLCLILGTTNAGVTIGAQEDSHCKCSDGRIDLARRTVNRARSNSFHSGT